MEIDLAQVSCYASICFAPEQVIELEGNRPISVVPRADIRDARLRYGFRAKHPVLLATFGLAMMAAGISQVVEIAIWMLRGGVIRDFQFVLVLLILAGGWVVRQSLARGYVLAIDGAGGRRLLEFDSTATPSELDLFLHGIETRLGYRIERHLGGN